MSLRTVWVLPLAAVLFGCTPKIGNKCTLSTDCSQLGDRLCDTSQPNGYCTIFNCEPDNCPDSICVAFDPNLDPACKSADDGRWARFERTFCMRACSADDDCRDGYECIDLSRPENQTTRRAAVVDTGAADGGLGYGVCMAKPTSHIGAADAGVSSEEIPGVCKPFGDAGLPPPYTSDAGGAGGAGGSTGGTGGSGGS